MNNTKCWSCGKPADSKEDLCYGCWHVVCVSCANKYGHFMNQSHGRKHISRKSKVQSKQSTIR